MIVLGIIIIILQFSYTYRIVMLKLFLYSGINRAADHDPPTEF